MNIFKKMFSDFKKTLNNRKSHRDATDDLDLLERNPAIDGFHLFLEDQYTDYGYGRYPVTRYTALRYIGSTTNESILKEVVKSLGNKGSLVYLGTIVVMKGTLMEMSPVTEKYTETIEKTRLVSFELKAPESFEVDE